MPRSGLSEPRFNLLRSIRFIATVIFTLGAEFTVTFQSPTEHSVHCDTRVCSNRMGHLSAFQSPTEHSVHCDIPLTQHANAHPSFNLLRSIRFIATIVTTFLVKLPTWRLVRADRCFRAKSLRSAGLHFCFFLS